MRELEIKAQGHPDQVVADIVAQVKTLRGEHPDTFGGPLVIARDTICKAVREAQHATPPAEEVSVSVLLTSDEGRNERGEEEPTVDIVAQDVTVIRTASPSPAPQGETAELPDDF